MGGIIAGSPGGPDLMIAGALCGALFCFMPQEQAQEHSVPCLPPPSIGRSDSKEQEKNGAQQPAPKQNTTDKPAAKPADQKKSPAVPKTNATRQRSNVERSIFERIINGGPRQGTDSRNEGSRNSGTA